MFAIISLCLFYFSSTAAIPFQSANPRLIRSPPPLDIVTPTLTGLDAFQCYDPTFPPPGPFIPIHYSECIQAANRMLLNVRRDVPLIFSRKEDADIQLPWRLRSGNCLMSLDVLREDDEDIMCVRDAHESALTLCRMCVGGYYRHGGSTPVGRRGVVYISVYGTTPVTDEAAASNTTQSSHVVARQIESRIESRDSTLLNSSSLASARKPNLNTSNADERKYFGEAGPSPQAF